MHFSILHCVSFSVLWVEKQNLWDVIIKQLLLPTVPSSLLCEVRSSPCPEINLTFLVVLDHANCSSVGKLHRSQFDR